MAVRRHGHTAAGDRAVDAFSRLGEHAACWLALGAAGATLERDRARRAAWRRGAGTVAAAYVANTAIKLIVRRRRPEIPGLAPLTPTFTPLSFPSAHSTSSFAAARVYSHLVPGRPLYALAAAFAVSRAYLGVHYPSDVLAGAALGSLIGRVAAPMVGPRSDGDACR